MQAWLLDLLRILFGSVLIALWAWTGFRYWERESEERKVLPAWMCMVGGPLCFVKRKKAGS